MKSYRHILTTILFAAMLMLAGGCVHEFPDEETPGGDGKSAVRLDLRLLAGEMPLYKTITVGGDASDATRAASESPRMRYIVEVYDTDGLPGANRGHGLQTRAPIERISFTVPADEVTTDRYVDLRLEPGDYTFYAWSDYIDGDGREGLFYNATDLADITVVAAADGSHPGSTDLRQAFLGHTEAAVPESAPVPDIATGQVPTTEITVEMSRPLAKFVFISTDLDEFINSRRQAAGHSSDRAPQLSDYSVKVIYSGYMPVAFDAFIDRPFDARLGQWFMSRPQIIDSTQAMLGFDFMFVNGAEAGVQLALEIYDTATGEKIGSTGTITAPLLRGRTTEIRGRFLSSQAESGVGVNPDFDGDYNIEIR